MNIYEIIIISISLAMDAVTVSSSKALSYNRFNYKEFIIISLSFGIFQMIMPIIGYLLSYSIYRNISMFNNIISFIILLIIGITMIKENNNKTYNNSLNIKELILLSIATSIDALSIGITLSLSKVNIISSSLIIGTITFILSFIGSIIGYKLGSKYQLSYIGGILLIIIGIRILLK